MYGTLHPSMHLKAKVGGATRLREDVENEKLIHAGRKFTSIDVSDVLGRGSYTVITATAKLRLEAPNIKGTDDKKPSRPASNGSNVGYMECGLLMQAPPRWVGSLRYVYCYRKAVVRTPSI
jgi:hypothetical protein